MAARHLGSGAASCSERELLSRAAALDLRATTLDLRNSGDTAGTRDKVVGYGAWALEDSALERQDRDQATADRDPAGA